MDGSNGRERRASKAVRRVAPTSNFLQSANLSDLLLYTDSADFISGVEPIPRAAARARRAAARGARQLRRRARNIADRGGSLRTKHRLLQTRSPEWASHIKPVQ